MILDNPQIDTLGGIGRHPGRMTKGTCVACGRPIAAGAEYNVIFYGPRSSPTAFAAAHDEPPAGTTWERDGEDWPINPCLRTLERVYHCILDDTDILRYLATDEGLGIWHRGRPLDAGHPLIALAVANGGSVLLASGRWARARFTPGAEHPLHLEYQAGTAPGPDTAPIPAPALFRPGRSSRQAPSPPLDEPDRWFDNLVAGVDRGGPRWYIREDPMHAGETLEVYLPGAGWSLGRIETTNGGRHANVHVALATPYGVPADAVLPAPGLPVRSYVAGLGRGGVAS